MEVREHFNMDFKKTMMLSISEESLCKRMVPAMYVLFLQVIPFLTSLLPNGSVPVTFYVNKDLAYHLSSDLIADEHLKVSVTRPKI